MTDQSENGGPFRNMRRYGILAALPVGLLVATSMVDSLSTFAVCGEPNVVELNPFFDDPCDAFEWEILGIQSVSWFAAAALLIWAVSSGGPLRAASHLKSYRSFLRSVWRWKRDGPESEHSTLRDIRLAVLWVILMLAVSHAIAAISNSLPFIGLPTLIDSFESALEIFHCHLPRTQRYLLWVAAMTPLNVLMAQWIAWKLLRFDLQLAGERPAKGGGEPAAQK